MVASCNCIYTVAYSPWKYFNLVLLYLWSYSNPHKSDSIVSPIIESSIRIGFSGHYCNYSCPWSIYPCSSLSIEFLFSSHPLATNTSSHSCWVQLGIAPSYPRIVDFPLLTIDNPIEVHRSIHFSLWSPIEAMKSTNWGH